MGRPVKDLPEAKIKKYVSQGLGIRTIAEQLNTESIEVGRSTVYRAIKKLQGQLF